MEANVFRTASLADVSLLLDWASREGWNPGLDDASAFFATDPEGFFIAEMEGEPVAGISVVRHSPALAFLGLYLCLPEWRGRGIGLGLWNFALAHAEGRTVGLDGVAAQQDNYRKSGSRRMARHCASKARFFLRRRATRAAASEPTMSG